MILYITLGSAAAAILVLALIAVAHWRHRRSCAREIASLHAALTQHQNLCSEQMTALKKHSEEIETSLQSTQDVLRHGRFNRSTRGQAMHLLRSGMSPETAATALGVAKREVRLLARIAETLQFN